MFINLETLIRQKNYEQNAKLSEDKRNEKKIAIIPGIELYSM